MALLASDPLPIQCEQTSRPSLNHLVGAVDKRLRDGKAEGLRGFKVDGQFEFRRLLNRKIGRLGALEDFVHEGGGAPDQVVDACTVGHQSTDLDQLFGHGY